MTKTSVVRQCDKCGNEDSISSETGLCPSCENEETEKRAQLKEIYDTEENKQRILQLELKAMRRYLDDVPFDEVLDTLHEDDLKEYKQLIKKVGLI